jgi:hypothetical protein
VKVGEALVRTRRVHPDAQGSRCRRLKQRLADGAACVAFTPVGHRVLEVEDQGRRDEIARLGQLALVASWNGQH